MIRIFEAFGKCRGRVLITHGFNVSDGGEGSVGKLIPFLRVMGYTVALYSYPYRFLVGALLCDDEDTRGLMDAFQEGDVIIGHSNGGKLIAMAIEAGLPVEHAVLIHPALDRDWEPPKDHPIKRIDVYYSGKDMATWFARFSPWKWGAMGTVGPISKHPCFEGARHEENQRHSTGFDVHPDKYLESLL